MQLSCYVLTPLAFYQISDINKTSVSNSNTSLMHVGLKTLALNIKLAMQVLHVQQLHVL